MNLYLAVINWGRYDETEEAEWFHFVADEYDYEDIKKRAREFLVDNLGVPEDDIEIDNVWINRVTKVDGFSIEVRQDVQCDHSEFEDDTDGYKCTSCGVVVGLAGATS